MYITLSLKINFETIKFLLTIKFSMLWPVFFPHFDPISVIFFFNFRTSKIYVNNILIGSSEVPNDFCAELLYKLKSFCYTIKLKKKFFSKSDPVNKTSNNIESSIEDNTSLNSTNVGFKLLKSLGWTGGGLGLKNTGIVEPIQ